MEPIRRRLFTAPGEALLIARNAPELAGRFADWLQLSNLDDSEVLLTPLCAVPLPIERNRRGPRTWSGVSPELMWHPLMWLPERLSHRLRYRSPGGVEWSEPNSVWALRVIFEMVASGLYDEATGSWLDVLSTVDLDITNPIDSARVDDWLEGAPDEALDSIDLTQLLWQPDGEKNWAIQSAVAIENAAANAALAQTANSLIGVAYQTRESEGDDARHLWTVVTSLARTFLEPAGLDVDLWMKLGNGLPTPDSLDTALGELLLIRERYWPSITALGELANATS